MENIIPVLEFHGQEGIQAVSARALYAYLYPDGDPDNFSRWIKKFILENEYAVRGEDWVSFTSEGNPMGGRPSMDYHLRLNFGKKLALMATRSDRAEDVRDYFIAVETRARQASLVGQVTRKDLAKWLLESEEALEKAGALIAAQAPLVAYAEKVQGSPTSFGVDETAKELGAPVKAFREFVQRKYQFRRGRSILPLEEYGPNGRKWFEIKTRTYDHGGTEMTYHVSSVTGIGRMKLKEAWDRSQSAVAVT